MMGVTLCGVAVGYLLIRHRAAASRGLADTASALEEPGGTGPNGPVALSATARPDWRTHSQGSSSPFPRELPLLPAIAPSSAMQLADAGADADPTEAAALAAAQEREQQVEAIRASGPDSSGLSRATHSLGAAWEKLARAGASEVNVGSWECHRAGCFVDVIHKSPEALEDLTSKILGSEAMTSWAGTKTRTAPIRLRDGSVQVTWILAEPSDGGPPASAP